MNQEEADQDVADENIRRGVYAVAHKTSASAFQYVYNFTNITGFLKHLTTGTPYLWSHSVSWCLAEVQRNGNRRRLMGLMAREKLYTLLHTSHVIILKG